MSTIYEPTINLISLECSRLMKEMKKLEESSKIGTLSKEDYEAAAKTQNPIIANYLSAITTLRIAEDNEEDTIINDNF